VMDAESSVSAPVILSTGDSTQEWLPPRKRLALVKLESAGKPAPGAGGVPAESQRTRTEALRRCRSGDDPSGAGLAGRRGRGGADAHQPITADASTWPAPTNRRPRQ
uniref:Uncharacterized protein n=1 Tax=Rhinolophus ferrumequinum TaxID=59479 RepID=A0A671FQT8_RHIFE